MEDVNLTELISTWASIVFLSISVVSAIFVAIILTIRSERGIKPNWAVAAFGVVGGSILVVPLFFSLNAHPLYIAWLLRSPLLLALLPWFFWPGKLLDLKIALTICVVTGLVGAIACYLFLFALLYR